ncbi:uncharacterized protein LOC135136039 [Zophobas morio]|uniref:uncharacterized protein LOC135136039 n=1 Tax=Zophobas morio TaxID=2755281 RepID=UPI0030826C35
MATDADTLCTELNKLKKSDIISLIIHQELPAYVNNNKVLIDFAKTLSESALVISRTRSNDDSIEYSDAMDDAIEDHENLIKTCEFVKRENSTLNKLNSHLEKRTTDQETIIRLLHVQVNLTTTSVPSAKITNNQHKVIDKRKKKETDEYISKQKEDTSKTRPSTKSVNRLKTTVNDSDEQNQMKYVVNGKKSITNKGTYSNNNSFAEVTKRAWLHLGKVQLNTTPEQVQNYLQTTFPNKQFIVEQLPTRENANSISFKIGADYSLLEELQNEENWPENVMNCQSLTNKVTELEILLAECESDIVCLSEHWYQINTILGVNLENYRILNYFSRSQFKQGGTAIFGKLGISGEPIEKIKDLCVELHFECSAVRFNHPNFGKFIVAALYRSSSHEQRNELIDMLGSYNLKPVIDKPTRGVSCLDNICIPIEMMVDKSENFNNLQQFNTVVNRYGRLLDLIYSNLECSVENAICPLVDEDFHHPALELNLNFQSGKPPSSFRMNNSVSNYNFKKANFPLLYELITNADWSFLENINNVNLACKKFYDKLYSLFDLSVPKSIYRDRRYYPPWFSSEIISNLRLKWSTYKQHKKLRSDQSYHLFNTQRAKCKKLIKEAHNHYLSSIENSIINDPSKFWAYIQNKKGSTRIPGVMCYNNEEISNPADIVNAFGNYFHSVFIHSTPIDPASLSLQQCVFNNTVSVNEISVDDVRKHLQRSKNSQTTGVDGVPSFLLRDCASVLAAPLAKIFNRMLQYSTFPDIWKKAFICPVLKKGKTNDVTNYRPISLLCNFAKTFESIIYETIYNSVKPFISSYQHGFMANCSTVSNLAVFSQYLSDSLDDKCQVDVIYTDFQKAFDRIDHYVLLEKLSRFGFSEPLLKLIQSYLFDREFRVRYRNFTSVAFVPTSGVPQGSNLGPLLFLLFINDLAESVSCKKSLFADDFKLFSIINSVSDCFLLQQNLNSVTRWCDSNRLQLNISKCRVVSYSRKQDIITYSYNVNGILMERSQTVKDLGVVFDSKLAIIDHINTTVNK